MKVNYPVVGSVCVWIGNFSTENEFDEAVENEVVDRLRLNTPIEEVCEAAFEETDVSVGQILEGFSGWKSFISQALNAANNRQINTANAALVCYYMKCEDAPEKWGCFHFLGNFAGQDVV